jgi:uncharacterized paraquat-inducible protein A
MPARRKAAKKKIDRSPEKALIDCAFTPNGNRRADTTMPLPSKQIHCQCGHVTTLQSKKLRCIKCGKFLFYDQKEKRRHITNHIYAVAMLALGIGIIAFLFIEMIIEPLLR